jgi:acetyltransferase-like isoleucine patch superfamily enzyme
MKLISLTLGVADSIIVGAITYIPGRIGIVLRRAYWRRHVRGMGAGVVIDVGVQLIGAEYMSFGDHCWIDRFVVLIASPPNSGGRRIASRQNERYRYAEGDLTIGRNVHIGLFTSISAMGGVSIGDDAGVGPGCRVYSFSHHYRDIDDPSCHERFRFTSCAPSSAQALVSAPIVIEDGAAIGANCIVLPGATIGKDSWISAGSVVRDAIPEACVAAGNPARMVKSLPPLGDQATLAT